MDCYLCHLLKRSSDEATFIRKMEQGSLFLNTNQSFKGRVIFTLNRHEEDIALLDDKIYAAFNSELKEVLRALKIVFKPTLLNVGMFGNKVRHLHWHIIPRYEGDSNWGDVPWPNKPIYLSAEEYRVLALSIRDTLKEGVNAR